MLCGGEREGIKRQDKNVLQRLIRVSDKDPTLSCNLVHKRNDLRHLLTQKNQSHLSCFHVVSSMKCQVFSGYVAEVFVK